MTRAVLATLHNRVQQLFAGKVDKTGGALTGPLSVPAGASGEQVPQIQEVIKKSGDTMTGQLALPAPIGNSNPTLLGQFASSLASPGYIKLPGGLIIQWGVTGNQQTVRDVAFPIPFPAAILSLVTQANGYVSGYQVTCNFTELTLAGFKTSALAQASGVSTFYYAASPVHWMAIGH